VAENADDDLRIDAEIHRRLRALSTRMPEVVHVEASDEALERSVLIMTEIPGTPLTQVGDFEVARHVAEKAGADASRFRKIAVKGFGWVRRNDPPETLRTELEDYASFTVSYMPTTPTKRFALLGSLFAPDKLDRIEEIIDVESGRDVPIGALAHGDLDVTQIFCAESHYTGLIDFSELRGTEPEFDLGHFLLHDCETLAQPLFDDFLHGYVAESGFEVDKDTVRRSAVLSGLRQLCRWLGPERRPSASSDQVRLRVAQLANILDGRVAGTIR
jgi:hypothetical protein